MRTISNCMMSAYDVLPSEPRNFQFSNVGTNIGILHWDEPKQNQEQISGYQVTYTLIQSGDNLEKKIFAPKSPFILEDLQPDSSYEVFVQAQNFYGVGNPTTRIVFRTARSTVQDLSKSSEEIYDQAQCCSSAGVKKDCLPMCQYNASLSTVRKLTNLCKEDLVGITKCASGE